MSDEQPERPERPLVDGLIALGAVALAVGLILGGIALVGIKVLGVGGGGDGGGAASAQQSMSIPPMEKTTGAGGPAITLNTASSERGRGSSSSSAPAEPKSSEPTDGKSPRKGEISLSAGQLEVENFGRIDLTGIYPGGEGAVLQVQRFQGGEWVDFAATIAVSNETFTTYVQTGVSGVNTFRVIDKETGVFSNKVKVKVG